MNRSPIAGLARILIAVAAIPIIPLSATAGEIVDFHFVGPANLMSGFPSFPSINNDNANPSNNVLGLTSLEITGLDPAVDFIFTVANSGGTTEYHANVGTMTNSTGTTWVGFVLELGKEVGDSFVPLAIENGLDFDTPDMDPTPTASAFSSLVHEFNRLTFSGGTVADGESFALTFSGDVPDEMSGPIGYDFTLRLQPVVPEPSSLVLSLVSGMAVAGFVWRRRRRGGRSGRSPS